MREWIVKLNTIDGGAADALRVIEHFDTLVDQRSSALAMLRSAAVLADCSIGLEDPERGLKVGIDASGRTTTDLDSGTSSRQVEHFEEITVWLDRDEPPWPLDHLILERFVRSLHAVKKTRDPSPTVAATRILCDADSAPTDRDTALQRLGLGSTVTVVATRLTDARHTRSGLILDDHQIHLLPESLVGKEIPIGIAAGIHTCPATDIHREWVHARTALRVSVDPATGEPIQVQYRQLGSIATIVENVDADTAAHAPDVRQIAELQAQRPWVLPTLEALLSHHSIRETARMQRLHHSTMRQHINWLERHLGYHPLSKAGYARASIALVLWRIALAAGHSLMPSGEHCTERR